MRKAGGKKRVSRPPVQGFATIEEALEEIREGRMIIILDDEDRENEGDLAVSAEKIVAEQINFMSRYGRGLICMPMTAQRLDELEIPLMVEKNTSPYGTAFCVSVEARTGVSTGISAADRARTVRVATDPATRPIDLVRPGHIFPLRAAAGGVLERTGQTEAIVDLSRLAGLHPAGVICEVMNEDGTMARVPQLAGFARKHGLKMITIADLIQYRMRNERLIRRVASPQLPTSYGPFRLYAYHSDLDGKTHLALVMGEIRMDDPTLVRLHSECLTGDIFGSLRCDCGRQLDRAMEVISREGKGVIVYLRQEGRGIGLENKLRAYELQDEGKDTVEANESLGFKADLRDYGIGAQILCDLGVNQIRLMTNNPEKFIGLRGFGIEVVERVPLEIPASGMTLEYLRVKKEKLGHFLSV
ncbi:MAG TPA: bifunctional 3,4-dihydroxy-2-butanone-4-phosphate synthase/GTP cyclohydrolase II [Patescibacteria group bacterium]|jgi:3,4-dihydroxy 2-butanone 4-phosphate synthase/GTP cyclohydrolase II|nr:bifunctional 3,4-dihydroxy-2-butanone-4-phosphate synthase/GTP cyclohydrolase II [Patescibacteria group bacterium]